MSCTVAPAKARRNSALSVLWATLTNVLVIDVPMLAPMIIGMAVGTSKTEMMITYCNLRPTVIVDSFFHLRSEATMLTIIEVEVLDD